MKRVAFAYLSQRKDYILCEHAALPHGDNLEQETPAHMSASQSQDNDAIETDQVQPTRGSANSNKVTPPRVADDTQNRRISARLNVALETPVVWLQGPPGAGKTTAVARYVLDNGLETAWLRLDADDRDPATWFFYLRSSRARLDPKGAALLPEVRSQYLLQPAAFARRFFRAFFDRPKSGLLVFDDYQDIAADSPIHELLVEGLKQMPADARVLIVSRLQPPPAFARMRLNGSIDVIPADVLALTNEEATELALGRRSSIDREILTRIVGQTHGWAAGLVLMLEAAKFDGVAPSGHDVPDLLFDYFAGEIFHHLAQRERTILMILSIIPTMPQALLIALTEDTCAGDLVEQLTRRNYFTVRSDEADPHYRFHPLFRDFLAKQAKAHFTANESRMLHLRAAEALERHGLIETASALYADLEDWEGLTRLIRAGAMALSAQGRFATLESWLHRLPEAHVLGDPWLSYFAATATFATSPARSRTMFQHALKLMWSKGDAAGMMLAWAGVASSVIDDPFSNQGVLDADIEKLGEIMRGRVDFPRADVEFRVSVTMYLALNRRSADRSAIVLWRDRALSSAERIGSPGLVILARNYIALYALIDGDFATAREQFDVLPPPSALHREPLLQAVAFVPQGLGQMYGQIPGRSENTAEQALAASRESGIYLWTHFHAGCEAVAEGDLERARKWLRRTGQLAGKVAVYHGAHYQMMATIVALLAGDDETAVRSGKLAVDMTVADGWYLYEAIARVGLAQALDRVGQIEAARCELEAAEVAAAHVAANSIMISFLFLRADLLLQHGKPGDGLEVLRIAMAFADRTNGRRTLLTPYRNARLCALALTEGIHVERARMMIETSLLPPPDLSIEAWPWPLKIATLGGFKISSNGEPLPSSRKTPRRLFTLLKAIIAYGGTDVPETALVDAVWPDEDGDAGHRALDTALYRLRKLLGDSRVLAAKSGRVSLDRDHCWLDVWAFEAGLSGAVDAPDRKRALALYKGDFLAGDDEPWIERRRMQLASRFAIAAQAGA